LEAIMAGEGTLSPEGSDPFGHKGADLGMDDQAPGAGLVLPKPLGGDPFGDAVPLGGGLPPPGKKMSDLYTLELKVTNATEIFAGSGNNSSNVKYAAATRDKTATADIIVEAVISPDPGKALPQVLKRMTWTGGTELPDKDLQKRAISRKSAAKTSVKCELGDITQTMNVYVIGADPTGFQGDGGSHNSDNSIDPRTRNKANMGSLGVGFSEINGTHSGACEIQFTIQPPELITDGNAKLFNTAEIKWDVGREKQVIAWHAKEVKDGIFSSPRIEWTEEPGSNTSTWTSDDADDLDEDNNPWDGNIPGRVYGNDWPFVVLNSDVIGFVKRLNMREFVTVQIGGGSGKLGRNGPRVSDYKFWHYSCSIIKSGDKWVKAPQFDGNEIKEGNPAFPSKPKTDSPAPASGGGGPSPGQPPGPPPAPPGK